MKTRIQIYRQKLLMQYCALNDRGRMFATSLFMYREGTDRLCGLALLRCCDVIDRFVTNILGHFEFFIILDIIYSFYKIELNNAHVRIRFRKFWR